MQITGSGETTPGPEDWPTGTVSVDTIAAAFGLSRLGAASVQFTPGARTAGHTGPPGQAMFVTEGAGLCRRRGGPVGGMRPGGRAYFEPAEEHWHGAAPNRFMTHFAMQEADDEGVPVAWGEPVTDREYGAAHR